MVLEEVARVRKDLGYPPLVTPTSQIVGTQAVMNIIAGQRYKIVPNEVKDYLRGQYGRAPGTVDRGLRKKVLGDEMPVRHRPADDIAPMLPKATENVDPHLIDNEEDIISYIIYPQPALEYFKWRKLPPEERPDTPADIELKQLKKEIPAEKGELPAAPLPAKPEPPPALPPDLLASEDYQGIADLLGRMAGLQLNEVAIRKGNFSISFRAGELPARDAAAHREAAPIAAPVQAAPEPPKVQVQPEKAAVAAEEKKEPAETKQPPAPPFSRIITAPLVGTFYSTAGPGKPKLIAVGDVVAAGAPVCIVEAMKLFNEIKAPCKCKIVEILVKDGTAVSKDQALIGIDEVQ
jgi:oxaloacetate decarboxylase alpha subunit